MGLDTEATELSRRRMRDLVELDREFQRHYVRSAGALNGSTRFVNFMLTLITLLLASGIGGAIIFANNVAGEIAGVKAKVDNVDDKVNMVIEGRIRPPADRTP